MKKNLILTTALVALFMFVTVNYTQAAPPADKDKFDIENAGALTGRVVLQDGSPFPTGFVAFFKIGSDSEEHQDFGVSKRSPTMVGFFRKDDGNFSTQLFPAGSYFMGVVKTEKWIGGPPPKEQKRFSAIDKDGKYLIFKVKAAETVDIGTITVREPVVFPERESIFTVAGKVLNAQGQGVSDSVVVAKKDINDPKGIFISAKTDKEGAYELKITPGKFFFVARESLTRAGRPKPGGLMGTLGQTKPIGIGGKSEQPPAYIVGRDGDTYSNVDIIMFEIPIPDVKRQEIEAQVQAKKLDKSSLPADLPLMKQQSVEGQPSTHKPE